METSIILACTLRVGQLTSGQTQGLIIVLSITILVLLILLYLYLHGKLLDKLQKIGR